MTKCTFCKYFSTPWQCIKALMKLNHDHGLSNVGQYALKVLRLENTYRDFGVGLDGITTPAEVGKENVVDLHVSKIIALWG